MGTGSNRGKNRGRAPARPYRTDRLGIKYQSSTRDDDEYEDDWERQTVKELEKGAGYRYVEWQPIPQSPRKLIQSCVGKPYVLGDGSI